MRINRNCCCWPPLLTILGNPHSTISNYVAQEFQRIKSNPTALLFPNPNDFLSTDSTPKTLVFPKAFEGNTVISVTLKGNGSSSDQSRDPTTALSV